LLKNNDLGFCGSQYIHHFWKKGMVGIEKKVQRIQTVSLIAKSYYGIYLLGIILKACRLHQFFVCCHDATNNIEELQHCMEKHCVTTS